MFLNLKQILEDSNNFGRKIRNIKSTYSNNKRGINNSNLNQISNQKNLKKPGFQSTQSFYQKSSKAHPGFFKRGQKPFRKWHKPTKENPDGFTYSKFFR